MQLSTILTNIFCFRSSFQEGGKEFIKAENIMKDYGRCWHAAWDKPEWFELFDRITKSSPRTSFAWLGRACCYSAKDKYTEAMKDLDQALQLAPEDTECWCRRARIHWWQRSYEKAIEDFTMALEFNPRDHDARCRRGECYLEVGKLDEAEKDFRICLEIEPEGDASCGLEKVKSHRRGVKAQIFHDKHPQIETIHDYKGDVVSVLWSQFLPILPSVTQDVVRDYGFDGCQQMSLDEAQVYIREEVVRMREQWDFRNLRIDVRPAYDCVIVNGLFIGDGKQYYNRAYVWCCGTDYICARNVFLNHPWE